MPNVPAKLCRFSGGIGLSLNVQDKEKTKVINTENGTEDSYKVIKSLFPESECGKDHVIVKMNGVINKFRARFRGTGATSGPAKLTICQSDLPQFYVVADTMVDVVTSEFDMSKAKLDELKALCLVEFDSLIAKAQAAHKEQFNRAQYPVSGEALVRSVYMDMDWIPMFSPEHLTGQFASATLEKMREKAQENANAVAAVSAREVFVELLHRVKAISDGLLNPDARVMSATIEHLKEACNFATLKIIAPEGSEERQSIELLTETIKGELDSIDVNAIRKNAGLRADAGDKLGIIARQFGELGKRKFSLE